MKKKTFITREVERLLGVKGVRLQRLIWDDELEPPQKDGYRYVWTPADIERASWLIRRRDASDVFTDQRS